MKNKRHVWVVEGRCIDYNTFEYVWLPKYMCLSRAKARRTQTETAFDTRVVKYIPDNDWRSV